MYGIRLIEYDLLEWDALEEYLMGENIEETANVRIWGSDDCPECLKIKEYYSTVGFEYNDVQELVSGENSDVEAMVQLAFQDMRLPLIKVGGEWVDPTEVKKKIA